MADDARVDVRVEAVARAIYAELERQENESVETPYVGSLRNLDHVMIDGNIDLLGVARAALAAADAAAEADGWVLVPREPTEAMITAGRMARSNIEGGYGGPSSWEAMLAARPLPPSPERGNGG